MQKLLILMGLMIVIAIVNAYLKRVGKEGLAEWPLYAKKPLTQPELVLFHRLIKALPGHIVLAQVQVSRVLGVKKGNNFNQWNNRINRMSYDFIVCAKDSTVIAVIELDDRSHNNQRRQEADEKKDMATKSAGLKIIRWNVKSLPSLDEIRTILLA